LRANKLNQECVRDNGFRRARRADALVVGDRRCCRSTHRAFLSEKNLELTPGIAALDHLNRQASLLVAPERD
jgi:hypothetical protein